MVTAHPGPLLSDVLMSSPILADEDGAPLAPMGQGFEFGIDPTEDPELAMVGRHRVYMSFIVLGLCWRTLQSVHAHVLPCTYNGSSIRGLTHTTCSLP